MKTYAVTGGAGFIGSHIAEELLKREDARVRVIDDLSTGREENLAAFRDRIDFRRQDIRDLAGLRKQFEGVDGVFHMAALVSVAVSVAEPRKNHNMNLTGVLNVLEAAKLCGVRRVVQASSAAVYGNDPGLPKREVMAPCPESPYAVGKLAGEHYGRVFSKLYGLPVVSLRCFNVYGPRQNPASPYSGVISIFADKVLKGESPIIFGDGAQSRDFVYVKDVVKANLLAMDSRELQGGEVFNVATGVATSLLDLLRAVGAAAGREVEPAHEEPRPGDILHSLASIELAEERLGFRPDFRLENGISALIASLRA